MFACCLPPFLPLTAGHTHTHTHTYFPPKSCDSRLKTYGQLHRALAIVVLILVHHEVEHALVQHDRRQHAPGFCFRVEGTSTEYGVSLSMLIHRTRASTNFSPYVASKPDTALKRATGVRKPQNSAGGGEILAFAAPSKL